MEKINPQSLIIGTFNSGRNCFVLGDACGNSSHCAGGAGTGFTVLEGHGTLNQYYKRLKGEAAPAPQHTERDKLRNNGTQDNAWQGSFLRFPVWDEMCA